MMKQIAMIVIVCFLVATTYTPVLARNYYDYGPTKTWGYGGRWEKESSGAEDIRATALLIIAVGLIVGGLAYLFTSRRNNNQQNGSQIVYITQPPGGAPEVVPQAYNSSYSRGTSPFAGGYIVQGVGYVDQNYFQPSQQPRRNSYGQLIDRAIPDRVANPQVNQRPRVSYPIYTVTSLPQDKRITVLVKDPSWGFIKNATDKFATVVIGETSADSQTINLVPRQEVKACLPPEGQSLRATTFAKTRFGPENLKHADSHIQRDAEGSWRLVLEETRFKKNLKFQFKK